MVDEYKRRTAQTEPSRNTRVSQHGTPQKTDEHKHDPSTGSVQTTETDKPEASPDKGETVDPESVPDASGENSDGCVYGRNGGPNNCTVEAYHYIFEDIDASQSGDDYPPFKGGSPNKIAQLGDCLKLEIPSFDQIDPVAKKLLGGEDARKIYESWPVYWNAVFLNTFAGAASKEVGVDFSNAKFEGFYMSDKVGPNTTSEALPFGIVVTGAKGNTSGRHAKYGSVEISTENGITHIDVDLNKGTALSFLFGAHGYEYNFNKHHKRPTHPGDVTKQLRKRKVESGVNCVNE